MCLKIFVIEKSIDIVYVNSAQYNVQQKGFEAIQKNLLIHFVSSMIASFNANAIPFYYVILVKII